LLTCYIVLTNKYVIVYLKFSLNSN